MKKQTLHVVICILAISHCVVGKNQPDTSTSSENFEQTAFKWTETEAKILQIVNQKHYNSSNLEHAMISKIDAFLNTLDPHSGFLDPKTYKTMIESTTGEFYGVGIVIDNTRKSKDKFLTIVDTIPDGPSDKAGIKALDKIVEIDGKPLEGLSTEQATSLLKGERNSQVHVKILRENHPDIISFDITRDIVKEQNSLSFYIPDHNICYLSLNMFSENSVKQIEGLLQKAQEKKYKGLILDLRNNSGGLLTAAIEIAGLFLEKNSLVVVTKDKNNKVQERYNTTRDPININKTPIIVMVNNYTASAAEILAGVLKNHADGTSKDNKQTTPFVFLSGTTTFGKGSVQEVIPVSNNSAIKITTSLYYLPNDRTIQGSGIKPDFIIERSFPPTEQMEWFTKYYGREQNLENHIKPTPSTSEESAVQNHENNEQKKESPEENRWLNRAREMLQTDNQLRETISLINILDLGIKCMPEKIVTHEQAVTFLQNHYVTNGTLTIEEIKL